MKKLAALVTVYMIFCIAGMAHADLKKEVSIWINRNVAPSSKIQLSINTTNVPTVHMSAYKIKDFNLILRKDPGQIFKSIDYKPIREWDVNLKTKDERYHPGQRDIYRNRVINLPFLTPGAFLITADGGNAKEMALVNVTDLAIIAKNSYKRSLIWVTNATTHKVVDKAKVTFLLHNTYTVQKNGKYITQYKTEKIAEGITGPDGICKVKQPADKYNYILVVDGNDKALTVTEPALLDDHLKAHIQTDRPIYRPGQTVMYKAILRIPKERGYLPVSETTCNVSIKDPHNNVMDDQTLKSNAIGTAAGSFVIPSEAALGAYTIQITVNGQDAYHTFSVAEYRKPEFKVTVNPDRKRYLSGENVVFNLDTSYYFGAKVQQAAVTYRVMRNKTAPWNQSGSSWLISNDGNLYPEDTYGASNFVAEGTVVTDDSGKVSIPVKTVLGAPDSDYNITCTVKDASRREVTQSSSVTVYSAGIRLAMSLDMQVINLGGVIPVKISVVDLDGKPAAADITLTTESQVWNARSQDYVYKEFSRTKVKVPEKGIVNARVPAKTQGEVYITAVAQDSSGRKTQVDTSIWVAGATADLQSYKKDRFPKLELKIDKNSYTPGKTIKVWGITNQLDRPLLLTAEGLDIWQYKIVPAGKTSFKWDVPAKLEMSPNTYIVASQWTDDYLLNQSILAPVPDISRKLQVKIESMQSEYKPGDKAEYIIHTTGQDGHPVSAEVAVSTVDESLYATRPDDTTDLYTAYWGIRDNKVGTRTFSPAETEGGAYQRAQPDITPVRQRFVDTAFWNAQVTTDKNGTAKINFEMPGNLTTWRTTARAVTADTRVGTSKTTTQATRLVTYRLAAPRQFVKGDKLTLIATINNRTSVSHVFETAISALGLTVEGENTKKITVPGNKEGTVEWKVNADSLTEDGNASIKGRIIAIDAKPEETADLSDALNISVKVAPDGIQHRIILGGSMKAEKSISLDLPTDRIEPASTAFITLHSGFGQIAQEMASSISQNDLYALTGPADHLLALSICGKEASDKDIKDAAAALYARQKPDGGWGWWDNDSDPELTASILTSLARAQECGLTVSTGCLTRGEAKAEALSTQENLWERTAQLASAVNLVRNSQYIKLLETVKQKGTYLSPFTQLSIAEAYLRSGHTDWAQTTAKEALKNAVIGPETAYIPAGNRSGWNASTVETTAQALILLTQLPANDELQARLARWLAEEKSQSWLSEHEETLTAYALKLYVDRHPQSTSLGSFTVSVNGNPVETVNIKGNTARIGIPAKILQNENTIVIKRDAAGEIFYSIEAKVFRPATEESHGGMRVLRRYEVRNEAGLWEEVSGKISPSDPVRCTVVVWPNDRPDALRIVEPIPSGFEYIDSDYSEFNCREEVRDGAIIHYILADKDPVYFRYYLRPESEGNFRALPAYSEAIRRPSVRGNSDATTFMVGK